MIRRPPRSTPLSLHDALPILHARRDLRRDRGPAPALGHLLPLVRRRAERGQRPRAVHRSEEHTSELQSRQYLVSRLLLEKNTLHHYLGFLLPISICTPPPTAS